MTPRHGAVESPASDFRDIVVACEVRIALGGLEAAMCRGESGVFRAADGACSGRVQWRPRPVHDTKAAQKAATTPMRTSAREFRGRLALRLYVG